jgi:hypothetical protein
VTHNELLNELENLSYHSDVSRTGDTSVLQLSLVRKDRRGACATVTFRSLPSPLETIERKSRIVHGYAYDTKFLGITPVHEGHGQRDSIIEWVTLKNNQFSDTVIWCQPFTNFGFPVFRTAWSRSLALGVTHSELGKHLKALMFGYGISFQTMCRILEFCYTDTIQLWIRVTRNSPLWTWRRRCWSTLKPSETLLL